MKLYVRDEAEHAGRSAKDLREMALAVQANLALLRRLDARQSGIDVAAHDIRVPPPKRVDRFREILIDPLLAAKYSPLELQLRLREVWGQYCAMCWLFEKANADCVDFSEVSLDGEVQCATGINVKIAEVHAFLWCFRFEQNRRETPIGSASSEQAALAKEIPAVAFGKSASECSPQELLLAACEHAGMLAALRWAADAKRNWGEPGIMDVADRPF